MFGRGLEILLQNHTDIDVLGQESDIDKAIEQINEAKPDVVILDGDDPLNEAMSTILTILKAQLIPKVIGLNLQDNNLYIYEARRWVTKGVDDLVTAIQDSPDSAES